MARNLIFIDESESMQRAVSTIFLNNPEFRVNMVQEPSMLPKITSSFPPDIIVLSYNTIDTELKKSITGIKTGQFQHIPLVLLVPSDLSDPERETLLKLKADGFIYRPFDRESFISKIKRTLNMNANSYETPTGTDSPPIEDAAKDAEKIYDIAEFERKNPPENKEGEPGGGGRPELNEALENLLKDDSIFKEFQEIEEKPETEQLPEPAYEPATPEIPAEEPGPAAALIPEKEAIPEFKVKPEPEPEPETTPEPGLSERSVPEIPEKEEIPDLKTVIARLSKNEKINESEGAAGRPGTETISETGVKEFREEDADSAEEGRQKKSSEISLDILSEKTDLKILNEANLAKFDSYLRDAIEKTFEEIKPLILENINGRLPDIIERLVKEEIEKIKSQQEI